MIVTRAELLSALQWVRLVALMAVRTTADMNVLVLVSVFHMGLLGIIRLALQGVLYETILTKRYDREFLLYEDTWLFALPRMVLCI